MYVKRRKKTKRYQPEQLPYSVYCTSTPRLFGCSSGVGMCIRRCVFIGLNLGVFAVVIFRLYKPEQYFGQ